MKDDRKAERAAALAEAKTDLHAFIEELVEAGQVAAFKVEAPEIAKFIEVFRSEDIAPAMPGRDFTHERVAFTEKILADLLNHIANYGVICDACVSNGVSLRQFRDLCKQYDGLKELKEEAKLLYREKVSRAVHNRAIEGWLEPVFYQGKLTGYVRKFSDRMLEMQGKKVDPEYRDRGALDVNVAGGVLVVSSDEIQDKEAWLEEQRKRRQIDSTVVGEA
jgi:hypothetical protein